MEHRNDLEQILLNGLPEGERRHVLDRMRQATADKLADLESVDYDVSTPVYNRAKHGRRRRRQGE